MADRKQAKRPEDDVEPSAPLSPTIPATPAAYWRAGLVALAILIIIVGLSSTL